METALPGSGISLKLVKISNMIMKCVLCSADDHFMNFTEIFSAQSVLFTGWFGVQFPTSPYPIFL